MKHVVQRMPDSARSLVFGLEWRVLVGQSLDRLAFKTARKARATHYVRGGPHSHSVGLARLGHTAETKGRRLYSAAAAFAKAYPTGAVAARIQLPEGIWVGAALNGVVLVGGDTVHDGPASAAASLAMLKETHPTLTIFGDEAEHPLPPHAITNHLDAGAELKRATFDVRSLPAPLQIAVAVICFGIAFQQGLETLEGYRGQQQRVDRLAVASNAPRMWEQATRNWASNIKIDGPVGLQALYSQLQDVPLQIARWQVREVACKSAATQWQCESQYVRGPLGTNDGLVSAKPKGWTVRWDGADRAHMQWAWARHAAPLDLQSLPETSAVEQLTTSRWQELSPALVDLKVSPPSRAAIPAPKAEFAGNGSGASIPFPAAGGPVRPVSMAWQVTAPLRSLSLAPIDGTAALEVITLRYQPDATPSLARSALMATITGITYAY